MADLIAIGYDDETTAVDAMRTAEDLAADLIIQPDQIAAIVRHKDGKFQVITNHHEVGGGAAWGGFWGLLFGLLFFVPFLGAAIGAATGALMGSMAHVGIDDTFIAEVQAKVVEGTSALFLLTSGAVINRLTVALKGQSFEVIATSLSKENEEILRETFAA
jgi:uncharacterized membrane protein